MYKKLFSLAVFPAIIGFSAPVAAQAPIQAAGLQLARTNNCLACHQVDQKRVGPAFRVIAQRFAEIDDGAAVLAQSISKGSRGKWGSIPMPAQPQVNAANVQLIAAWILSLAGEQE